MNPKGIDSD